MKNKIKVLVTGGAGYVGSATVRHLLAKNYEVYVIDNLMQGGEGASSFIGYPGYYFIKGDINDEKLLSELIKKVDYVVHLAAIVGEGACKKDPDLTKKTNIEATKKIINLSSENNIKRIIFFSTCSSYGVQDINVMATENSPLNPVSLYAESKIFMEEYLSKNYDSNLSYTILRPSTVHGISPRMRFDLIVNHFCKDAIANNELEIFGGELWRPLMWVGEVGRVVDAIFSAELGLIKNQVFNLGNTNANKKKKEVAEIIKEKFLPEIKLKYTGKDEDLRSYRVDFSKLETTLNFKLEKSLEDAIKELIFSLKNKIYSDPNNSKYKN
jgi:nucleoside-diphosphate-sugar epimerase